MNKSTLLTERIILLKPFKTEYLDIFKILRKGNRKYAVEL